MMSSFWGNIIGAYLLAGVVINGLGHLVQARWVALGKTKPLKLGKHGKLLFGVGITVGVLFWPVFLIVFGIGWRMKRRTRKLEKFLGYCAHRTAWEPFCNACRRDIERESAVEGTKLRLANTLRRLNDMESRLRKEMEAYIKARPECLKCGKAGGLSQYLDSVWVKCSSCGRRTYTPDPSVPEEVDMVPAWLDQREQAESFYDCSACKLQFKGIPPAADADGFPLCVKCKLDSLRSSK